MTDHSQSSSMVSSAPRVETVWTLLPADDNSPIEHVTWNFDTPQGVAFELDERLTDGSAASQTTCSSQPPQNLSTVQLNDESITIVQQVTITSQWSTAFVQKNPEIVSMLNEIYVVLDHINTERVVCGLPKLVLSPKLCKRAYDFADVSKDALAPIPHKRYMWFADQRRKYQGNATSIEETAVIDSNETANSHVSSVRPDLEALHAQGNGYLDGTNAIQRRWTRESTKKTALAKNGSCTKLS